MKSIKIIVPHEKGVALAKAILREALENGEVIIPKICTSDEAKGFYGHTVPYNSLERMLHTFFLIGRYSKDDTYNIKIKT